MSPCWGWCMSFPRSGGLRSADVHEVPIGGENRFSSAFHGLAIRRSPLLGVTIRNDCEFAANHALRFAAFFAAAFLAATFAVGFGGLNETDGKVDMPWVDLAVRLASISRQAP
jgi:hypothetical protein